MNVIDTHSHIYLEEFDADLPQVIERARTAGVTQILLPNIDSTTVERMLNVCNTYSGYCYPMIGIHPTSVDENYEKELAVVERELATPHRYIGIGEAGLDLYWDKTCLNEQKIVFDKHIQWALAHDLPLVVHSREAFEQIHEVMQPYRDTPLKGIFHSFTGSAEEAVRLLEFEGFMLGINGVLTFKNTTLPAVLKQIPMERVVLETDAPFLTPVPYRGKRNESACLKYILTKMAEAYGVPPGRVAEQSTANALKVFAILQKSESRF